MPPGHLLVSVDPLTVRHHFVRLADPLGSGAAVAETEPVPEKVELLAVVHEMVGATLSVLNVNTELVTERLFESVTVIWKV